jgi:plastocyanin
MRLMAWTAVAVLGAVACGGGEQPADEPAAQPAMETQDAAPAGGEMAATGTVHTVNMEGDGTRYWFAPDAITIKSGDRIDFVNVSGGPHNVAFYEDQIPAGAKEVLERAMSGRTLGPLNGAFVTAPDEVYSISFAGAPVGSYGTFCLPHEALGMKMTINIEE